MRRENFKKTFVLFFCLTGSCNLNRHDPNAPPGVFFNLSMAVLDSFEVSIKFSFNAPRIPFSPHSTLLIFFDLAAVSITPQAEAFITAVTPPD